MMKWLAATIFLCLLNLNADAAGLRIGTWNIANLHHEVGVPLRPGAEPRDQEDFDRLRAYAASLELDVIALQEIGSPRALALVFPNSEYHLIVSNAYKPGDENKPVAERDIFTAFAVRKSAFPTAPVVENLEALGILHVGFDRDGTPSARPVRGGMVMDLSIGGRQVKVLNVHLKSSCHANSLSPVFDTRFNGDISPTRFDCRTLAAQAMILENWIEQQTQQGRSVVILGDFNRQFNRLSANARASDHFWTMINDGTPNGLQLRKGPGGKNEVCWPRPHRMFHEEHIEFIVFDASLDQVLKESRISKQPLPHQDDPKYAGSKGQKLSDHCPVVTELLN
jgi:endonuclease/exonuclease/phosphatase family metal-dependent hydrolase